MSPLPTRTRYPGRSAAFHVDPSPRHPRVLGTPAATTFSCRGTRRNIRTAARARRRSTRTKTERWTRETPPKSADDARRPSASSRETPHRTLLGSFQRRTVSHLRDAPAPRTAELLDEERASANAFAGAPPRSPARTKTHHRHLVEARCDSSAFHLCSKTLAALRSRSRHPLVTPESPPVSADTDGPDGSRRRFLLLLPLLLFVPLPLLPAQRRPLRCAPSPVLFAALPAAAAAAAASSFARRITAGTARDPPPAAKRAWA